MNLLIILVFLLVICSAFFSSAEIAFATANKPRIKSAADNGDPRAQKAQRILDSFVRAISTILVGNNLVNIAATSVVTLLCTRSFFIGNPKADLYAEIISTLMLLIFGEIFPKLTAANRANSLALRFASPLGVCMKIFFPVVWLVEKLVHALSPLWTPKQTEPITDEELSLVVDSIQEDGVITEEESELIKSAIEFKESTAQDILIPRVDMLAYDLDEPLDFILKNPDAISFSRIPVYRESIDHIVGVLPVKALLKTIASGQTVNVESMLLPPMFVHMTKDIGDIMKEMRETHTHMAIVLDEYGGTMGLLTMEDILEEIVGEIYDETDEVEPEEIVEVKEDTFLLDGGMNIEDAFDEMEYIPHEFNSAYTTLSGWITEMLDRFPKAGDSFAFEKLTVTVAEVDGPVVTKVRIVVDRDEDK